MSSGVRRAGAAVVKVRRWRHSARKTRASLAYLLGKASRTVDDWGAPVSDPERIVCEWGLAEEFGRSSVEVLLSLPNEDAEREWAAAHRAAKELFGAHPYVCVLRTDTSHPHVQVVVRARSYDGYKLAIDRDDLARYRETLARCGRAEGIDVGPRGDMSRGRREDERL